MTASKCASLGCHLTSAATLAAGFGTLWFVLVNFLGDKVVDLWRGPEPAAAPAEEVVVRADGTPLIQRTVPGGASGTLYDLNGGGAIDSQGAKLIEAVGLNTRARWSDFALYIFLFESDFRAQWEHRLRLFVDDQHKERKWYFVHDGERDGAGYFVGYEGPSKRRIGYIGQSGFVSGPKLPHDPFPVRTDVMGTSPTWTSARLYLRSGQLLNRGLATTRIPSRLVYVPCRNEIFLVDLSTRQARSVFRSTETIESFDLCSDLPAGPDNPFREGHLLVRTTDKIYLIDREHAVLRAFPIPSEADRRDFAVWYEVGDGRAWVAFHRLRAIDDLRNIEPRMLYLVAAAGTIVDRAELMLESGEPKWHKRHAATTFRWSLPVPAALPFVEPLMVIFFDQQIGYGSAFRSLLRTSWLAWAGVAAISALFGVAAWRRARAFALPGVEQIAWPFFVFLGGFPAYVGFLLHRRWPLRQACPRCRARVPWDRHECAACGKLFPSAAKEGTEICC